MFPAGMTGGIAEVALSDFIFAQRDYVLPYAYNSSLLTKKEEADIWSASSFYFPFHPTPN